jgi:hypothetical protein
MDLRNLQICDFRYLLADRPPLHITSMVWLYRSPNAWEWKGTFTCSRWILLALSEAIGGGGWRRHSVILA